MTRSLVNRDTGTAGNEAHDLVAGHWGATARHLDQDVRRPTHKNARIAIAHRLVTAARGNGDVGAIAILATLQRGNDLLQHRLCGNVSLTDGRIQGGHVFIFHSGGDFGE